MGLEARDNRPASGSAYDVERIRADFPILYRQVNGKPLVYLDNGASAQKPRQVLEAMDHAYRFEYANVHRGLHYLSNMATAKFEEARETIRRFLNAPSAGQIVITRNATSAINLVAQSFGGLVIGDGDEIVLSIMEHHANIVPWHYHRERKGAVLKWAPIDDRGELIMEEFERLLTPRTKIVAITHMSNVLGTVNPIKEIVKIAHARGIPVLVDGSQSAAHMPVDVRDLDCDFFVFTGHKTYGPTGIGVLYAKKEHLDRMPPYEGGGDRIAAHEAMIGAYAHERLGELNWLKIHGTVPGKGAIVAFSIDGLHPHDIATIIDRSGIAVRAGHHCAQPLMERLGVPATCRASFAMYSTKAEVDALVDGLRRAHELFA